MAITPNVYWKKPKSQSVGSFTDLTLYYDALKLCSKKGFINVNLLQAEISERVVGIKYIEKLKERTFSDLIKELELFKFIQGTVSTKAEGRIFEITREGRKVIYIYEHDKREYFRFLAGKMHEIYTIPGWFVARLLKINPNGQGQVIIPAPLKTWNPKSKNWDDNLWSSELDLETRKAHKEANKMIPDSFPIDLEIWVSKVKTEYERLGSQKQRVKKEATKVSFSPRRRLSIAMKEIAISILFNKAYPDGSKDDFNVSKQLVKARNFMTWSPRLEALELLFYTDYSRGINGRLIFPVSIFRFPSQNQTFESIDNIKSPEGKTLYIHNPDWYEFKKKFIEVLFEVYQSLHNREKILYVALQDVRDEVCRRLRISSILFEMFLEKAFKSSLMSELDFSIALETDIREDQSNAFQQSRRPVYIQSIPHSLIAIKPNK